MNSDNKKIIIGFTDTYSLSSGVNIFISDSNSPSSLISINHDNKLLEMKAFNTFSNLCAYTEISSYMGLPSMEQTLDMMGFFLKSIEGAMEIETAIRKEIDNLVNLSKDY